MRSVVPPPTYKKTPTTATSRVDFKSGEALKLTEFRFELYYEVYDLRH